MGFFLSFCLVPKSRNLLHAGLKTFFCFFVSYKLLFARKTSWNKCATELGRSMEVKNRLGLRIWQKKRFSQYTALQTWENYQNFFLSLILHSWSLLLALTLCLCVLSFLKINVAKYKRDAGCIKRTWRRFFLRFLKSQILSFSKSKFILYVSRDN